MPVVRTIREWISENLRSIFIFFLPSFILNYFRIELPSTPSQNTQQNNGEPILPSQNRLLINRIGCVNEFDECGNIETNTHYSGTIRNANLENGQHQMPVGANVAILGQGPVFRGRHVQNIITNETYGQSNNNNPRMAKTFQKTIRIN